MRIISAHALATLNLGIERPIFGFFPSRIREKISSRCFGWSPQRCKTNSQTSVSLSSQRFSREQGVTLLVCVCRFSTFSMSICFKCPCSCLAVRAEASDRQRDHHASRNCSDQLVSRSSSTPVFNPHG